MAWWNRFLGSGVKFVRLSGQERRLLLEALVLSWLTAVALRTVGFRRWQAFLASRPRRLIAVGADAAVAACLTQRAIVAVGRANRLRLRPASCLHRSLTLGWLLGRHGIDSELRIGIRKRGSKLEAHAWLEHCGRLLYDPGVTSEAFLPFVGPVTLLGGHRS